VCADDETPVGEVSWFQGCVAVFAMLIVVGAVVGTLVLIGR
jgi:hypothetical protein